jgi:sec-independent protein translocase protein TatB
MFDVSFSELAIIGVVALVVIGPERLPKVARTVGHLMGRAQRYVNDVKADIQREIQLEEFRKLKENVTTAANDLHSSLAETEHSIRDAGQSLRADLDAARQAAKSALNVDAVAQETESAPIIDTAAKEAEGAPNLDAPAEAAAAPTPLPVDATAEPPAQAELPLAVAVEEPAVQTAAPAPAGQAAPAVPPSSGASTGTPT